MQPLGQDVAQDAAQELRGLEAAIAGSSPNTNAIATLEEPAPDNETLRLKLNELILAARR